MENRNFHSGNIVGKISSRNIYGQDIQDSLPMHLSLMERLSLERELEGYRNRTTTVAFIGGLVGDYFEVVHNNVGYLSWNPKGSRLISGSSDAQIKIWRYPGPKLLQSFSTDLFRDIQCIRYMPDYSDEFVVSAAQDIAVHGIAEGREGDLVAKYKCHIRRVRKIAVHPTEPKVVWTASLDGTMRQHDLRETSFCEDECRSLLFDLRLKGKASLADPPRRPLCLQSCDISSAKPHLLVVSGRRKLPMLSSRHHRSSVPEFEYCCPTHLSKDRASPLTHAAFSPTGGELLLNYMGENAYLMNLGSPAAAMEVMQQYVGHTNREQFAFKEAIFLGQRGEYVASGSEDGRLYIWEKRTGRLVKMLRGDEKAVNCVQCHPSDCIVATSGTDGLVKIWTPSASAPHPF